MKEAAERSARDGEKREGQLFQHVSTSARCVCSPPSVAAPSQNNAGRLRGWRARAARDGMEGSPLPYQNCSGPDGGFGDTFIFFPLLLPLFFSFFFSSPPALFVEPNQKCQSVRVSQKGSDYKITETDVGPAHTHPHTEAEARAAPRGRRAGIKQPPTTPAGPPLPPPSSLVSRPVPLPAGCPPNAAGAGPASRGGGAARGRAGGPGPRPWAARGLGGSGGRYVPTWARSSLFPQLYSGPLFSSPSAPAPLPAPFPLP